MTILFLLLLLLKLMRCSNALKRFRELQVRHLCSFSPHTLSRKEVSLHIQCTFSLLASCDLYVFTTQYDKSSLKMYLDEYILIFNICYIH